MRINNFLIDNLSKINFFYFNFLASIIIFFPVLLGYQMMPGTDLIFSHYPNLIYGYDEFQNYQELPRWTGYIFHGYDFTASMHSHFFNVYLWPLLYVPRHLIIFFYSIYIVLINALIGYFWVKIAQHYIKNSISTSLFIGLFVQSSLFFWWNLTTFNGAFVFLFSSILLYLIMTLDNRSFYKNLIFMSLALSLSLQMSHPSYLFGYLLPPFLIALKKYFGSKKSSYLLLFFLVIFIGLLFNLYRLIPILISNINESGHIQKFWNHANNVTQYFMFTLFNPLLFGVNLGESIEVGRALQHIGTRHSQFHTSFYFGIIPLILISHNLFMNFSYKKFFFVFAFLFFMMVNTNVFVPFENFFRLFFFPFNHTAIPRILSFYCFIFLLILTLRDFVSDKNFLSNSLKFFSPTLISFFFIALLCIGIYFDLLIYKQSEYPYLKDHLQLLRLFVILLVISFSYFIYNSSINKIDRYLPISFIFFTFFLLLILFIFNITGSQSFYFYTVFKNLTIFLIIAFQIYLFISKKISFSWLLVLINLIFILFLSILIDRPGPTGIVAFAQISILGWVLFMFIPFLYFYVIFMFSKNDISKKSVFFIIFLIAIVDNIVSFNNYTFVNIWNKAYVKNIEELYPKSELKDNIYPLVKNSISVDKIFDNYSVNFPAVSNNFSGNEVQASVSLYYQNFSYGGVDSIVPLNLYNFLSNSFDFLQEKKTSFSRAGIISNFQNKRLLELLGIYINYNDKEKAYEILPNAVPNISLFSNVKCVHSDDVIKEIFDENLIPNRTLIIQDDNNECFTVNDNKTSIIPDFLKVNSQEFIFNFVDKQNYYLNFNQNNSNNWRAFWNEKEIKIYKSNGHAMAVRIPSNENGNLRLVYSNNIFEILFLLTKILFLSLSLISLLLIFGKKANLRKITN